MSVFSTTCHKTTQVDLRRDLVGPVLTFRTDGEFGGDSVSFVLPAEFPDGILQQVVNALNLGFSTIDAPPQSLGSPADNADAADFGAALDAALAKARSL